MKIKLIIFSIVFIVLISSVSAGIGIKYSAESALVNEDSDTCLDYYSVYNPWEDETYALISVSDEFSDILTLQDIESILIPAQTPSSDSIPLKFCFHVPNVYEKDCAVGSFVCEKTCSEEQKVYGGEVVVRTTPGPTQIEGTGGSATQMSISAPLRIRVQCIPHGKDFTIVYVLIALISAAVIFFVLFNKFRKPKSVRDKEKLKKLRAEIAKVKKKKK